MGTRNETGRWDGAAVLGLKELQGVPIASLAIEMLSKELYDKFWKVRRSKWPKWQKKRSEKRIARAEAWLLARFLNEQERQQK